MPSASEPPLLSMLTQIVSQRISTCEPRLLAAELRGLMQRDALLVESAARLFANLKCSRGIKFLYQDPGNRFDVQIFMWPPGFGNKPHLHKTWAISIVLANAISVYRSDLSESHCELSIPLIAREGELGCLDPPQYHCLRNHTERPTCTLHIFQHRHLMETLASATHEVPSDSGWGDRQIVWLLEMLQGIDHPCVVGIIEDAFEVLGEWGKLEVVKLLSGISSRRAIELGYRLADALPVGDQTALLAILRKIESRLI